MQKVVATLALAAVAASSMLSAAHAQSAGFDPDKPAPLFQLKKGPKELPPGGHAYIYVGNEQAELRRVTFQPAENNVQGIPLSHTYKRHVTWGVIGLHAATVIHAYKPQFRVAWHGMAGVVPAEYMPRLIRLTPYRDAGRVAGATDYSVSRPEDAAMHFTDPVVPATVSIVNAGEAYIEVDGALAPGDYAIVLRPKNEKILTADAQHQYETMNAGGAMIQAQAWQFGWDFTVK